MRTRALFEILGFQEDWEAITDQRPAYYHDFGNLRLTAAEVMSYHGPRFLFSGVIEGARSVTMVDFEMPLEVESFEQGVAWIWSGIGEEFRPRLPTPWLEDGRTWQDHLPWVRRMEADKGRPQCLVERDWFRVAIKKLHAVAASASENDLVWLAFDGEALRIAAGGVTIIVPATGTAWDTRHAVKGTQLSDLPRRLTDAVPIAVWDGKISIGSRVWSLAASEAIATGR